MSSILGVCVFRLTSEASDSVSYNSTTLQTLAPPAFKSPSSCLRKLLFAFPTTLTLHVWAGESVLYVQRDKQILCTFVLYRTTFTLQRLCKLRAIQLLLHVYHLQPHSHLRLQLLSVAVYFQVFLFLSGHCTYKSIMACFSFVPQTARLLSTSRLLFCKPPEAYLHQRRSSSTNTQRCGRTNALCKCGIRLGRTIILKLRMFWQNVDFFSV